MAEGGVTPVLENIDSGNVSPAEPQSESKMDGMDVLLERIRSERQNELREIQNNNRPVTGQDNRNNINQFMRKNAEVRETVQAAGKDNVPLNSRNVEEHRPDAVVIEIQGVSQQQRVSSMLQTAGFRRNLENIIRGSIRSVSQNHRPTPSPILTPRAQTPIQDTVSPRPPAVEQQRRDSVSSRVTTASSSSASSRASSIGPVDYNSRVQDPRGLLGSILNNVPATPPAPPIIPTPAESAQEINWHTVEEFQQEELVQEVSELVHRRLVTTALDGELRNVLERHLRNHLEATGSDGERVQEFIRSIPQSQLHVQNDFSELGIPPPNENNWDNVSIHSVTATTVPYSQSNLHLGRQIVSLKAQLEEMKNMMKVSFDLQMDIQRSIRQEVAAGLAAAAAAGAQAPSQTTPQVTSTPVNDTHCLICLDNHSDSVLYQCGHMCVCFPCGRHLMDRGAKCPVCRAPIRDIIRAYKCNQD
ncbi:uncharacterized protein LOC128212045 [Mya arenaria]|uniref:uncharacterized protein LOC128212045 n=1 Tax=Mya arenaria TaxID=6604 RepID=UPI0022DFEB22|nr:uncharacterized protein LOC128212045 [Mya arenaria]